MRMLLRSLMLPYAALALWPSVAVAGDGDATCPAQIETEQSLRKPVAGFEVSNTGRKHDWAAITIYEGRPEQMVALKYDTEADSGDGSYVQTWNLDRGTEYWIRCQYAATSLSLLKKLPPVGECKVSVSGAQELALACR